MFTFCPLQGARSESHTSQSLLEFDGGIKLLIGVGWDESFDPDRLKELQKHVPTISLILLTHPTVPHLAAYAHCCKTIPLFSRIPVYATRPVIDLGRTLIQDLYASSPAAATTILSQPALSEGTTTTTTAAAADFLLQAPTPDEIARYFSAVQALKYSQPHQPVGSPLSPPLSGLTVTAYNAGHTLGGTIWHIQHGLESVVYAVDWNQARENVFAGAAWLGGAGGADVIEQLRKPTALICSSRGAADRATSQQGGRARRDEQLLEMIRTCVSRGGTVLIPIDSSARVLEVAYLLEHAWRSDGPDDRGPGVLRSSKLFLAGRNMSTTMRYARSMLEWMDDAVVREFEAVADNMRRTGGPADSRRDAAGPLDFRFLRLLEKPGQIDRLLAQAAAAGPEPHPGGRVFIASDSSMEWGFSKDLLRGLAADPNNLVILTEKPALCGSGRPSAARTLWDWWKEGGDGAATERDGAAAAEESPDLIHGRGRELSIRRETRQPLEGEDLGAYQQWIAAQRHLQAAEAGGAAAAAGLDAAADAADDGSESSSSSDESDTEQQGKALTVSAALNQANRKHVVLKDEDLGVNILVKKKGAYDFFCRSRRDRDRAFPVVIRKRRMDGDYGEPIRQEDYLRTEEREGEGAGAADEEDKLGKKKKWDRGGGADAGGGGPAGARAFGGLNGSASTNDVNMLRASAGLMFDPDLDEVDDPSEDPAAVASQGPCRLVVSTEMVPVHLRLGYVDFTGLHDRRSLHMLIPLIQPRKLILVAGAEEETLALAEDCRKLLGGGGARTDAQPAADGSGGGGEGGRATVDVYTPAAGTWVNASVDTNAWVLKLGEPLAKGLLWQRVKGISVVTLSGQLFDQVAAAAAAAAAANSAAAALGDYRQDGANKRQKTEEPEDHHRLPATTLAEPALPVLDSALGAAAPRVMVARRPLHVGDVRLADLRRGLQSAGHAAEFRGEGTLLVDGSVAVRKGAAGLVEVENWGWGTRREAFLEVRRMVYESLALVRGG